MNLDQFVIHPCFREALRSTSSVAVQPFEPVVARRRFEYEGGLDVAFFPQTRGHRSFRTLDYMDRACERVRAALVEASVPAEIRQEVNENLRAIQNNAEQLRYDADPYGDTTIEQVELSHRAMEYFRQLRAKLTPSGLVAGDGGAKLDRALERSAREIRNGLIGTEFS